tara:strand:- start:112 stop:306 length:195 start_codon:yes stop_codon:yes gene_type:complete
MIEYFIIFAICIIGVGYSSYRIGIREGSENMLEMLENTNIIKMDFKGNVVPNPDFYKAEEKTKI